MMPHGANGSNVSWDFSAATPLADATVDMTASNAAHPGTNLVYDYAGQAQLYYQNDNTQQSIKYQVVSGIQITFSDQMKIFHVSSYSFSLSLAYFFLLLTDGCLFYHSRGLHCLILEFLLRAV